MKKINYRLQMYRIAICTLCFFIGITFISPSVNALEFDISARAYILMEASTGRILQSKNENKILPIASTTKIMTALIALEQEKQHEYFIADEAAIKVEGSSMGLQVGDSVSLFALAHGMLLSSGNDAANAAAVKISGSIEKFAVLMNERAAALNMENTNFVTPSGLHDENHYSTAYDMALLAREALKNKHFTDISSKEKAQVVFGNPPYKRTLFNHNRLVKEYEGCIGVKTGFTKNAGRCLVSAAERNGVTLICVTLNASNDWRDHQRLLDYGFNEVTPIEIKPNLDGIKLNLVGAAVQYIEPTTNAKTNACTTPDMKLTQEIYAKSFYYAPIKKGEILGEIRHIYNGNVVAKTDLIAKDDIPYNIPPKKESFLKRFKDKFLQ